MLDHRILTFYLPDKSNRACTKAIPAEGLARHCRRCDE